MRPSITAAAPHKWQRPSMGWMIPATSGDARYEPDGTGR